MAWAPDYVTSAELKSYLNINNSASDDTLVAIWVTTASRSVDSFCGRQFGQVGSLEDREYQTTWDPRQQSYVAEIDDVQNVGSMIVLDSGASEVDDYTLSPVNAVKKGKPYERIHTSVSGPLVIQAMWGWTAVPTAVKNATLLQAARLAKRRDSPFGIAGSPGGTDGNAEVLLRAVLDPDLRTSLMGYRRTWWAA